MEEQIGQAIGEAGKVAEELITTPRGIFVAADIVVVVIFLLFAAYYWKKGIYQTVVATIIIVVSLFVGIVGSNVISPTIYEKVYPKVEKSVTQSYEREMEARKNGDTTPAKTFTKAFNHIIESYNRAVDKANSDEDNTHVYKKIVISEAEKDDRTKEVVLRETSKAVDKLIRIVVFGLIVAIMLFVCTTIKNYFGEITEWVIIKQANKLAGMIFGLLLCYTIMYLLLHFVNFLDLDGLQKFANDTVVLKYLMGVTPDDIANYVVKAADTF